MGFAGLGLVLLLGFRLGADRVRGLVAGFGTNIGWFSPYVIRTRVRR
jgi:hypothetical protein